jgi:hypothetical protein
MRPLINDVFSFGFRQYAFEDRNSFGTTVSEEHWRTWESGRTVHALPKVIVTTKSNRCRSGSTTFFKANAWQGVYSHSVISLAHLITWMKESSFPHNHCYKVSIYEGFTGLPQYACNAWDYFAQCELLFWREDRETKAQYKNAKTKIN